MSDNIENFTMEDVNKSLYVTIKLNLRHPLNKIVIWGIFGDGNYLKKDNSFIYSNYADIEDFLIKPEHVDFIDGIEKEIKHFIHKRAHSVDFSTMDSADKGMADILDDYLRQKNEEIVALMKKKKKRKIAVNAPIFWAPLIISHREMALFAFENGSYYLAIQYHEACREFLTRLMFNNVGFIREYQKMLAAKNKKIASKGGSQKGINYSKPREIALDYHDKHFSQQDENGRFIYSSARAAKEIVQHFDKINQSLGYEPSSLANIISPHRKQHFTK